MSSELNLTCDSVCPWFAANGSDRFSYAGWKRILASGTGTNCAARFGNSIGAWLADGLSCAHVKRAENTKRVSGSTIRRRGDLESLWRRIGLTSFGGLACDPFDKPSLPLRNGRRLCKIAHTMAF